MDDGKTPPVLILGAGINGCAVARELLLSGVGVCVVDAFDIGYGASSKSSRLIHGGLRYLEYGDVRLVRESLEERTVLRETAPQFVEPLRLYIPVRKRFGGFVHSVVRFLHLSRNRWCARLLSRFRFTTERGVWLVRMGLWLYDRLARDDDFPAHESLANPAPGAPAIAPGEYKFLCAYSDAQMRFPERFLLSALEDCRKIAAERGIAFDVHTYCHAQLDGTTATIRHVADGAVVRELKPRAIVNATGAWGDFTLAELQAPSKPLFGGTKGSHLISFRRELAEALSGGAVYAEAADGRMVFVLPFGEGVLIGTTDERFPGRPEAAIATEEEILYLIEMVNHLFAGVRLGKRDVAVHYCGVRPLPRVEAGSAGAISRGHSIAVTEKAGLPILTLIGGKLTTCRAFAEHVATELGARLGFTHSSATRARSYPGGEHYPVNRAALEQEFQRIAGTLGISEESVRACWALCGNRVEPILAGRNDLGEGELPDSDVPVTFARHCIESEWVTNLSDLVERRLMLVFAPRLTRQCVVKLAELLVAAGRLNSEQADAEVGAVIERLATHYGRRVE